MDLTDDNLTTNNNVCPCCSFDVFLPPSKGEGYDDDIARQIDRVVVDRDGLPQSVETVAEQLASARRGGDSDGTEKGTTHRTVMVVDTHGHPQLNRDRDETYAIRDGTAGANLPYLSLACAVGPDDFVPTLEYAATSSTVLPAIGCHPWYVDQLDVSNDGWLDRLERLLVRHPSSIVGEIGLCKIAKWVRTYPHGKAAAMDVQRRVFKQQMELAAKLRRPVTVHCFDAHGMFMSVMKELVDASALPPAIGMHR
jgi:TatD DNase family protein